MFEVSIEPFGDNRFRHPYMVNIYIDGEKKYVGRRGDEYNKWIMINVKTGAIEFYLRGVPYLNRLVTYLCMGFKQIYFYNKEGAEIYRQEGFVLRRKCYISNTEIIFQNVRSVCPIKTTTQFFEWTEKFLKPRDCYSVYARDYIPGVIGYVFSNFVEEVLFGSPQITGP